MAAVAAHRWAAEWPLAVAGMVQAEQAQWQFMATTAIASLLRAKIAQLAVLAAGVTVRVRWLMWAVAREITYRRLHTSTSAVAVISLDPVEISLA